MPRNNLTQTPAEEAKTPLELASERVRALLASATTGPAKPEASAILVRTLRERDEALAEVERLQAQLEAARRDAWDQGYTTGRQAQAEVTAWWIRNPDGDEVESDEDRRPCPPTNPWNRQITQPAAARAESHPVPPERSNDCESAKHDACPGSYWWPDHLAWIMCLCECHQGQT